MRNIGRISFVHLEVELDSTPASGRAYEWRPALKSSRAKYLQRCRNGRKDFCYSILYSILDNRSSPALSMVQMPPEKEPSILIGQLRMAVNVLTAGTCSDEGLEDATTLLLHLSRTEPLTRDSVLDLLLEGAQETSNCLMVEIQKLLHELKERNAKTGKTTDSNKV